MIENDKYIPSNVILEVSALCNVSCLGCGFHGPNKFVTRSFGNMEESVWRSVINEIGSWNAQVSISAHGGGEPLLNPDLKRILLLAKSFSNIKIGFLTNGMLFDEAWADFVIDLKLDWIAFSVDGVSPKQHKILRQKSDLNLIETNIHRLIAKRREKNSRFPEIKLNMVAYDEIIDIKNIFINKWIDSVEYVQMSNYRNPPQSKKWPEVPDIRKPCNLLWSQLIIAWNGYLGLCCEDFNMDFDLGKVNVGESLLELWNAPSFSEVRDIHLKGEYYKHPMCADCDTWAEEYTEQIYCKDTNCKIMSSPSQSVFSK